MDDHDRVSYLSLLKREIARQRWRCLTYCLMDNHVHLLLETPEANLASGMRRLHGFYAQRFNRRHRRSGHLFGSRYGSVRVEDDAQLWMTIGYIARNPVAAGLVASAEEWRWGSHAAIVGDGQPPWLDRGRLWWYLAGLGGEAAERYLECVAATG